MSLLTRSGAATVWVATTRVWLISQLTESSATRTGMWVKLDLRLDPVPGPLDQVFAGQPVAVLGQGGEQDLAGFVGPDRVVEGEEGVAVHDLADRFDPVLGEDRHRHLDPGAGRLAQLAGVDQLADGGLVLGRGDGDRGGVARPARVTACSSLRPPATSLRKTSSGCARARSLMSTPATAGSGSLDLGAFAGHDRVAGAGHPELVGAADDPRDLVEVEDRRRRGDLPLDRVGAPGVGAAFGPKRQLTIML